MIRTIVTAGAVALALVSAALADRPIVRKVGGLTLTSLSFADLRGWDRDDHAAALTAFRTSCARGATGHPAFGVRKSDWQSLCNAAGTIGEHTARSFFEQNFQPVRVENGTAPMVTGYYEPELKGSRTRGGPYRYPIYAKPRGLPSKGKRYFSRAQIEDGALRGMGLELFWLTDPVEAFFLQIQGSGRIRLPDGKASRVGYAGRNGHPYRSIGQILVENGIMKRSHASAARIKRWVRANPSTGQKLLNKNASFVFFRELPHLHPDLGPLGALEVPLKPMRSIAVDRAIYPLGAPVWIDTPSPVGHIRQLTIAQDVGSAIKGAQRADLFFGSGSKAGHSAGQMKYPGSLVALVPRTAALRVASAR